MGIHMDSIKVAAVQIAPVFLRREATWDKLERFIREAASNGAKLITWGETLIPGYPQWLSPSGGARFNDSKQKRIYAKYWEEAVDIAPNGQSQSGIIQSMCALADELEVFLLGGLVERESGSVYATIVTIDDKGNLIGRHRKVKPTYEERLVWADGDAEGLITHEFKGMRLGSLNCWESWIPHTRIALHDQGETLHVSCWPGSLGLTEHISKFMALEGRSYVISVSGILRSEDFEHLNEDEFPVKDVMIGKDYWQNGGSMIVNPRGEIIAGPLINQEGIIYADIDPMMVIEERQNFDYSGHYSRPDIFPRYKRDK